MFVKFLQMVRQEETRTDRAATEPFYSISTAKVCCMSASTVRVMYGRPTTAWS